MTGEGLDVAACTARLRQALEEIATALAAADLDGLLRAESSLELALRRLSALPATLPASERDAVRREVRAARHTLDRCRMLGGALIDVVRLSLDAQGRGPGYGPAEQSAAAYGRRSVDTTG